MEQDPINLVLIGIGTVHENMQTEIRFPLKGDDLRMRLWML